MKKIGIITLYYENYNYGGNLQAYALVTFLNNNGYDAKQICYSALRDKSNTSFRIKVVNKIKEHPLTFFCLFFRAFLRLVIKPFFKKRIKHLNDYRFDRREAFSNFQLNLIPHTEKEYYDNTLFELNNDFDFFITGSDQVFNFSMYKEGFFLNFVEGKPKFSYAASMAMKSIPKNRIKFLKKSLSSFVGIGIREEKTIDMLKKTINKEATLNIDPVFLLKSEDWDKVSSKRIVDEEYIFCYFLGPNRIGRLFAMQIARKHSLKIVCIPCAVSRYKYIDESFGDYDLNEASPEDFISLIKHAKYVFTDSFHACAFSLIYHKQFIVFNRDKKGSMGSRIISLMRLLDTQSRFIDSEAKSNIQHIEFELNCRLSYDKKSLNDLIKSSIDYLNRCIER